MLRSFAKPHAPGACPISAASYCGTCAIYGHSPANCPDVEAAAYSQPLYVEQLLPPSLLELYSITSTTPLPHVNLESVIPASESKHFIEVPETDDALRAAVTAAGGKPMICQQKGKRENRELLENKKRLIKLAEEKGQSVIFITPPKE